LFQLQVVPIERLTLGSLGDSRWLHTLQVLHRGNPLSKILSRGKSFQTLALVIFMVPWNNRCYREDR